MPKYRITLSDGRKFMVTADGPPSESDVMAKLGLSAPPRAATPPPAAATADMMEQSTTDGDLGGSSPKPQSMMSRFMRPDIADLRARVQSGEAKIDDIAAAMESGERDRIVHNARIAPAAGGLVGGMVGGIPGAAVGGAIGEAVRQTALRSQDAPGAPETVGDQALQMGRAGVTQGALQGAGQAVAWGGGKLAKWLMNRATTRVTARLARDFPELSDTLIDNALTVSKGGESKARMLLKVAKGKAVASLDAAEQAGAKVPIQLTPELADSLKTAVIEAAMKAGKAAAPSGQPLSVATARLDAPTQAFLSSVDDALTKGTPLDLGPKVADLFKTQLQRESRALYAAVRGPNGLPAITKDAAVKAEYASRLNDAIDAIATGYKAANAEAQPLVGAVRGIAQASRPSGNLYQAMVRPAVGGLVGGEMGRRQGGVPGAIAGGVAGAAMTSPAGMSREAIILASPVMQGLLKQMPRATAEALTRLLSTEGLSMLPSHSPQGQ